MADPNASVFDLKDFTVTRRVAQSYQDDVHVPIKDGVPKGGIAGQGFLADIHAGVSDSLQSGVDQTIIFGDQVEEIRGSQKAKVTGDHDIHIVGSLKILIDAEEERTVKGTRTTTIKGYDILTVVEDHIVDIMGDTHETYYGSLNEFIVDFLIRDEVSDIFDTKPLRQIEVSGEKVELTGGKVEAIIFNGLAAVWDKRAVLSTKKIEGIKGEAVLVLDDIQIVEQQKGVIAANVKGVFLHGKPGFMIHPAP
jgi:hypothetical protein